MKFKNLIAMQIARSNQESRIKKYQEERVKSSKKLFQDLGIIDVFENIVKEINKKNPKGDFLLLRNKMLGLPLDSKKQFFVFPRFILVEGKDPLWYYYITIKTFFPRKQSSFIKLHIKYDDTIDIEYLSNGMLCNEGLSFTIEKSFLLSQILFSLILDPTQLSSINYW